MSATNQQRAEEWFNRDDHDLLVAESSLRAPRIAAGVVCYLCQQCTETYLKGFLTSHTTPVRRTHDLTALLLTRVPPPMRSRSTRSPAPALPSAASSAP